MTRGATRKATAIPRGTTGTRPGGPESLILSLITGDKPMEAIIRAEPDALDYLAVGGDYSEAEIFDLVVPKRTLARRKAKKERLTIEETDKALRLARIANLAQTVFGDAGKAHRWLRKPKRHLNDQTPLAYLASEAGARVVEDMLRRIEYGVPA